MEDDGVGLERLLVCEVARNGRVSAHYHRDDRRVSRRGTGEKCGGVRKPSALAPEYLADNL